MSLVVVVALLAALITTLVNNDDDPTQAAPPRRSTTTTTTTEDEPSPTTTTTTSTATTTTTTAPPATQQPPAQQQQPSAPATPAQAITDYYALMPGNLDQAWNRLTPKFQNYPAGGRSGYAGWWSKIASVAASDVAQTGNNVVEVTLLYTYKDGHRVVERHRYTLVNQNGSWLIDAVRVLSSSPA